MRLLFALLGFLALTLAPLATPVAAAAVSPPCMPEMMAEHVSHGPMPIDHDPGHHAQFCCVSLASALPDAAILSEPIPTKPLIGASRVAMLSGVQPSATDPPPRTV
jgi:hypothetical protein